VDEQGNVRNPVVDFASLPAFGEAAKAAVAQWKFTPALREGKPVALKIRAPVGFAFSGEELAQMESSRTREPLPPGPPLVLAEAIGVMPVLTKEVKPKFSREMGTIKAMGEALLGFIVDENGEPRDVHTVMTTHLEYAASSLAAIRQWKFKPGQQNGRVVRTEMRVIMNFTPDDPEGAGPRVRPGVLRYIEEGDGKKYAEGGPNMVMPKPTHQEPPNYPRALERMPGKAVVEFVINEFGVVTHVASSKATHPYFAVEAERAVSKWTFQPGTRDGQPVRFHVHQLIEFEPWRK
jgi:TonB family protein